VNPDDFFDDDHRWAGHWKDGRPAHAQADVRRVEAAVAALPKGVAAIVLLRDVEGLSADEVVRLVGRSPDEQLTLLHQGRTAIRAALELEQ
jgi:DNA-directed RNA polymerase specialized sigma24 family protein